MESKSQTPEFRNNPENFHPCIFGGYFHLALLAVKTTVKTGKYSFKFRYTISNIWTHLLSMLVSVLPKSTFER